MRAAVVALFLGIAAAGFAWALLGVDVLEYEHWLLACPLRKWTGLECPGCGMTHALVYLGRLQPAAAFAANPLVPVLGIFLVGAVLRPRGLRIGKRMGALLLLAAVILWLARVFSDAGWPAAILTS
jgi:hypothetical protein